MQIHQWGGFLTSSIAINRISWLWNVLTYNLNVNHWRIATKDPIIASTHRLISIRTHTLSNQQILTNGFKVNSVDTNILPTITMEFQGINNFYLFNNKTIFHLLLKKL